jgi:ArsR family transcriptional regulator
MAKTGLAVVGHAGPTPIAQGLSAPHALAALAGLGQPTRLEIFRLLMRSEPDGLPAGTIAEVLNVDVMKSLITYLANDCCEGHPELCDVQDALRASNCGCKPAPKARAKRKTK